MNDWREQDAEEEVRLLQSLHGFLLGDRDAIRFCLDIAMVIHYHDDRIDGDKVRSHAELNRAFRAMMVMIPGNPFYVTHGHQLRPLILSMIFQWEIANTFEQTGTEHEKHMAWMLRAFCFQLFHYCAYLVGGEEHALKVGPNMARLYTEPLEDFMREMGENNA